MFLKEKKFFRKMFKVTDLVSLSKNASEISAAIIYLILLTNVRYIFKQTTWTPGQSAPDLIWVHTVCHRGFLNISTDDKSRRLLL